MYYTIQTKTRRGNSSPTLEDGLMPKEKKQEKPGRPPEYTGPRKPITIQWPVDLITYIDGVTDNRTRWLIEAAREKMEREQSGERPEETR